MPAPVSPLPEGTLALVDDRFVAAFVARVEGVALGGMTGEFKNADGEGIVIASMGTWELQS